jgi:DNA-binding Lrp family transcriptional regulator
MCSDQVQVAGLVSSAESGSSAANSKLETRNSKLSTLEKRLLNDFQRDFPLSPTPFADIASRLGVSEEEVLQRLRALKERGAVSRVGAVVRARALGASCLAALSVPPAELERVAAIVSGYREVNHNYEREHAYNLWYVVTAPDMQRREEVIADIEIRTGLKALRLPMEADYHIDLGFELRWA